MLRFDRRAGTRSSNGTSSEEWLMKTDDLIDIGLAKDVEASERAQWGLASLLIGLVSIIAALMTLIFNVVLWQSGHRGMPRMLALIGMLVGLLVFLGLAGFGIAAGHKGRKRTFLELPASPLATAGVVTGWAAIILWLMIGFDLLVIMSPILL
jgi:hypothetical protein